MNYNTCKSIRIDEVITVDYATDKQIILDYRGVEHNDIPNIDIYMDQLLTFFDQQYDFFKRDPKENILTKSMINNYVKAGVMNKPRKKKYNRDQIKILIIIFHLKQVMSIQDIQTLFHTVADCELSNDDFYDSFLTTERTAYEDLSNLYSDILSSESDNLTLINTIMALTTEACAKKRLAEKLLDQLTENTRPDK